MAEPSFGGQGAVARSVSPLASLVRSMLGHPPDGLRVERVAGTIFKAILD